MNTLQDEIELHNIRRTFDRPYQLWGLREAPQPQGYENESAYRIRMLQDLQGKTTYAGQDLKIAQENPKMLANFEERIRRDLETAPYRDGVLRELRRETQTGEILEYVGPKRQWMSQFQPPTCISPVYENGVPKPIPVILSV